MFQNPATIEAELNEELALLYKNKTTFLSEQSEEFLRVKDKADILGKANAVARSLMLVRLFALAGNEEQVNYYLRNASALHADKDDLDLATVTSHVALGKYLDAYKIIQACGAPERHLIPLFLRKRPSIGIFQLLSKFEKIAEELRMHNVPKLSDRIPKYIEIMSLWGDEEEDYVRTLEVAAQVLRSHGLHVSDNGLGVRLAKSIYSEDPPILKLAYEVSVPPEEAIELTCEFAELLAKSGHKIPQSFIFEFLPAEHNEHEAV
jgi:hypothetical protein